MADTDHRRPERVDLSLGLSALVRSNSRIEVGIVCGVLLVVLFASFAGQQTIARESGRGWDGVHYYAVAEQLRRGATPEADAPFVQRLGTPLLVSLLPVEDLLRGFEIVNAVGGVLAVALLLVWLRSYIADWRIRSLLAVLFIIGWNGPIRFTPFYPAYVDPWGLAMLLAGLCGLEVLRRRDSWPAIGAFSLFTAIAVVFRGSSLMLAVALLWLGNPLGGGLGPSLRRMLRTPLRRYVPLATGIFALVLVQEWVIPTGDFSTGRHIKFWAMRKPFLGFVHGAFIAFGPILVLALYNWRSGVAFLREQPHLLFVAAFVLAGGWAAGNDTERILYWGMPLLCLLVGRALVECRSLLTPAALGVLLAAQLLSQRVFWTIPGLETGDGAIYTLFTQFGDVGYFQLRSFDGFRQPRPENVRSLAQYALFSLGALAWLGHRARRAAP